jgi:hypothetical protein
MERLVQIVDLGVLGVLGGQKEAKVTLLPSIHRPQLQAETILHNVMPLISK